MLVRNNTCLTIIKCSFSVVINKKNKDQTFYKNTCMRGCYWFNHSNIRFSFICLLLYPSRVHLSLSLSLSLLKAHHLYVSLCYSIYIYSIYKHRNTSQDSKKEVRKRQRPIYLRAIHKT